MDSNYSTINIFPVPIHVFDVSGFKEIQNQLIDYAYNLKEEDEGITISNEGGWHSHPFEVKNVDDVLQKFLINCLSNFPNIHESINFSVDTWVNINKPGDYNTKHHHPDCHLSGVLWVKASEESGRIEFQSPVGFQTYTEIKSYTEEFKNSNNYFQTYYFSPIEGRMLVFPSHLQHEVLVNKSNEDRISVSFNIRLK